MKIIMQSERVDFVPMDVKYVDFYIENMNNPEIYRHLSSNPRIYTREDEIEWLENNKDLYQFTLIDRNNKRLIGNAGYHEIVNETGELGIWITPEAQNYHYGYEVIMRLIEYGYKELHLKKITLKVHDNNDRAKHLYEKIGFVRTGIEEEITDGIGNPTKSVQMKLMK